MKPVAANHPRLNRELLFAEHTIDNRGQHIVLYLAHQRTNISIRVRAHKSNRIKPNQTKHQRSSQVNKRKTKTKTKTKPKNKNDNRHQREDHNDHNHGREKGEIVVLCCCCHHRDSGIRVRPRQQRRPVQLQRYYRS